MELTANHALLILLSEAELLDSQTIDDPGLRIATVELCRAGLLDGNRLAEAGRSLASRIGGALDPVSTRFLSSFDHATDVVAADHAAQAQALPVANLSLVASVVGHARGCAEPEGVDPDEWCLQAIDALRQCGMKTN